MMTGTKAHVICQYSVYLAIVLFIQTTSGFLNIYGDHHQYAVLGDVGEPLFLTPLIKAGNISEAKKAANVKPFKGNVKSYAGYLTVNEEYKSNLFFWFIPSETHRNTAPVIVWLQGGPGASSLFGLFSENGPYIINNDLSVDLRNYSWSKTLSVLYIDNPVGTGYSFTDKADGYAQNEEDVAINLYNAVLQFFKLFPELVKNPFFVSGESYAGKYVPALSYIIHKNNPKAEIKINLHGLAIGNGLCDPENMLHYGDYLYELGLIDLNAKKLFHDNEQKAVSYIKAGKFLDAFVIFDKLLNADLTGEPSVFYNCTGLSNYFNYLESTDDTGIAINKFIQQSLVRKTIHVGNLTFHTDNKVEKFLQTDMMKSVAPWIEILIENYRTLFYNGQLDIIVAYPLTLSFLQNLKWSGAEEYKTARRNIWKISKKVVAGYSKSVKNFTEVLVRDAGHMVPMDQPLYAWDMINRFVFNKPFNS